MASTHESKTIDVIYNACHGGFGYSQACIQAYAEATRNESEPQGRKLGRSRSLAERCDPVLVGIVRKLGGAADGPFSKLQVATFCGTDDPADLHVSEYDGIEDVAVNPHALGDFVAATVRTCTPQTLETKAAAFDAIVAKLNQLDSICDTSTLASPPSSP